MKTIFLSLLLLSPVPLSYAHNENQTEEAKNTKKVVSQEMERVLAAEINAWYPRSVDTMNGGFFSDMNYKWELFGRQNKMIVTQARHVWSTANAAMFYQEDTVLRSLASHGFKFLKDKMWDKEFGGFYSFVSREGEPLSRNGQILKEAYGNAFAIYGLSKYFRASGDTASLKLAQKAFWWLEKNSYDSLYGGYFQYLSRDGVPFIEGNDSMPPKDQNSSIHILEAFTELYRVWPDELLRERLTSLLHLVRETLTTQKGYIRLFFKRDWTPISTVDSSTANRQKYSGLDHISFGHDVEIGYLLLEASEALGIKKDTATITVAKRMIDHALDNGFDYERGGLFDGGFYFAGDRKPTIVRNTKEWWGQAEALNSFLMMSDYYPHDAHRYFEKFLFQWRYCKQYLIDSLYGGWYWGGTDIVPGNKLSPKGSIWKCNYHTSRGLINCIDRLRHATLPDEQRQFDPVNNRAISQAKKLLQYLYSIHGKKILAGHHNSVQRPDIFIDRIKELTGKSPEVWGCDFMNYYRNGEGEKIVQAAYNKYQEGYIITLMWHAGRPQDDPPYGWKESVQAKLTDAEWNDLMTPGTKLHTRWIQQIDTIAHYLKELQELGVPVLWRPYHQANRVWFWWGNRKGQNGSAQLYRMMFDRFVKIHKLNNLLWVWNTNAPRQLVNDEAFAYEDFFPGLQYVDVLATDVYHSDYRQSHHDDLARLGQGKIIALGEIGQVPSPDILENQPLWTWFMIWSNFVNTHNTPQQIQDLYQYPKILTHEKFIK